MQSTARVWQPGWQDWQRGRGTGCPAWQAGRRATPGPPPPQPGPGWPPASGRCIAAVLCSKALYREVLLLGLAGLGRVGTPVCGDLSPASPDTDTDLLCLRWIQVGKSKWPRQSTTKISIYLTVNNSVEKNSNKIY